MTLEQWNAIKVGDVLIDRHFRDARRKVIGVKRNQSKNSALTRTSLTVSSLKQSGGTTIVFETENTGPHRFDLDGVATELSQLEAERQQVIDEITDLYWVYTRQARGKPPCVVAPHLYTRRRELTERIAKLRAQASDSRPATI